MSSDLKYGPLKPISSNIIANVPYSPASYHHDSKLPVTPLESPTGIQHREDQLEKNDDQNGHENDENMAFLNSTFSPRSKTQGYRRTTLQTPNLPKRGKPPIASTNTPTKTVVTSLSRRNGAPVKAETKKTDSKLDLLDDGKMTTLPIPPPPLYKHRNRSTILGSRTETASKSSERQFKTHEDCYDSSSGLNGKCRLHGKIRVHNVAGARYVSYSHNSGNINESFDSAEDKEGQAPLVLVEDYISTTEEEGVAKGRQHNIGNIFDHDESGSGRCNICPGERNSGSHPKRHGARKQVSISDLRGKLEKRNDSHIPLRLKKHATSVVNGDKREEQRVSKSVRSMVAELMNVNNLRDDSGDNYLSNFKIKIKLKKCVVCEKPLYELSSMILNRGDYKELVCEDCTAKYEQAVRIFENCEFESTVDDIDSSNNSCCSSSFISEVDRADDTTEMTDSRNSVLILPRNNRGISSTNSTGSTRTNATTVSDPTRPHNLRSAPSISAMTSCTLSSATTLRDLPRMKLPAKRRDSFFSDELIKRLRGQLEDTVNNNLAAGSNNIDNNNNNNRNSAIIGDGDRLEKAKDSFCHHHHTEVGCSYNNAKPKRYGITGDRNGTNGNIHHRDNDRMIDSDIIATLREYCTGGDNNDNKNVDDDARTTKTEDYGSNNHDHVKSDTLSWTWFQYARRRIFSAWRITGIIPFFMGNDKQE